MSSKNTQALRKYINIKHGFAFSSDFYSDVGDYVLLTPGNFLAEGGFRWLNEKQKFYSGEIPTDYILSPGQMLIAMTEQAPGLLGSSLFVPKGHVYLHNQRLGLVTIKQRTTLSAEYLHYYFASASTRRQIANESTGTKVKHTSPDKLLELLIDLPQIKEQRRIADILRSWDEAIALIDAGIRRLLTLHSCLVGKLVFGQSQFPRYSTHAASKQYRWFRLPANWQCRLIGSLAREISERNRGNETNQILSCSKHDGFVRSLEYFKKQVFSSDLTGYKRIYRGDFGFPSNHVEEGSIGLQNLTDLGLVSPIYTVFRFAPDVVDNKYAHYVLKTSLYRHIFELNTSASVDRRGSLRWDEFASIPFPVPPLEEQRAIAEALSVSVKRIALLREERRLLNTQKRGLMQKLLTGQWRVKL